MLSQTEVCWEGVAGAIFWFFGPQSRQIPLLAGYESKWMERVDGHDRSDLLPKKTTKIT